MRTRPSRLISWLAAAVVALVGVGWVVLVTLPYQVQTVPLPPTGEPPCHHIQNITVCDVSSLFRQRQPFKEPRLDTVRHRLGLHLTRDGQPMDWVDAPNRLTIPNQYTFDGHDVHFIATGPVTLHYHTPAPWWAEWEPWLMKLDGRLALLAILLLAWATLIGHAAPIRRGLLAALLSTFVLQTIPTLDHYHFSQDSPSYLVDPLGPNSFRPPLYYYFIHGVSDISQVEEIITQRYTAIPGTGQGSLLGFGPLNDPAIQVILAQKIILIVCLLAAYGAMSTLFPPPMAALLALLLFTLPQGSSTAWSWLPQIYWTGVFLLASGLYALIKNKIYIFNKLGILWILATSTLILTAIPPWIWKFPLRWGGGLLLAITLLGLTITAHSQGPLGQKVRYFSRWVVGGVGVLWLAPTLLILLATHTLINKYDNNLATEPLALAGNLLLVAAIITLFRTRQGGWLVAMAGIGSLSLLLRPAQVFTLSAVVIGSWFLWRSKQRHRGWLILLSLALPLLSNALVGFAKLPDEKRPYSSLPLYIAQHGLQVAQPEDVALFPPGPMQDYFIQVMLRKKTLEIQQGRSPDRDKQWSFLNLNIYYALLPVAHEMFPQWSLHRKQLFMAELGEQLLRQHWPRYLANVWESFRDGIYISRIGRTGDFTAMLVACLLLGILAFPTARWTGGSLIILHGANLVVISLFEAPLERYVHATEFFMVIGALVLLASAMANLLNLPLYTSKNRETEINAPANPKKIPIPSIKAS